MKNKSYIGISFIVLIFGIWAVPKIIAKFQKSDLVEIGPVPAFKLTNQENKSISDKDYLGKVYVVEFFFSTCPTICPKMNQSMLQLQEEFYGNPNFGIASIIEEANAIIIVLRSGIVPKRACRVATHIIVAIKLNPRFREGSAVGKRFVIRQIVWLS